MLGDRLNEGTSGKAGGRERNDTRGRGEEGSPWNRSGFSCHAASYMLTGHMYSAGYHLTKIVIFVKMLAVIVEPLDLHSCKDAYCIL